MTPIEAPTVPPGVVLAEYYFDEGFSALFIIRRDPNVVSLHQIDRSVSDLRQFVLDHFRRQSGDAGSEDAPAAAGIEGLDDAAFNEFFAPFVEPLVRDRPGEPALAAEGETVWFVPSDALFYVPLHAISVDGRPVIERNPVCYTPSASIMAYCQQRPRGSRSRALVVGDPLGDLGHAREEAMQVAGFFHTSALVGPQATKQRILAEIERSRHDLDVLHFSCHGYFHAVEALRSGILFAPPEGGGADTDVLTAEEIVGLELNAELVALSACDTGINERRPGDELMGLTRALLFAGSSAVLVSLWEVDDLSTAIFMNEFYQGLVGSAAAPPLTKARALQRAENTLRTLSVTDVIAVCDAGLSALDAETDRPRVFRYRIDRAEMQATANDREAALDAFATLEADLSRYAGEDAAAMRQRVADGLAYLRALPPEETWIDYEVHPFAGIYHWAPFILVGDWH